MRGFSPQNKGMMSDGWLLRETRGQLHFNFHRCIATIFHSVHKFHSKLPHLRVHLSLISLGIKLLFTSYDSPRYVISNLFSPPFIDAGFNFVAYTLPLPGSPPFLHKPILYTLGPTQPIQHTIVPPRAYYSTSVVLHEAAM